MLERLTINLTTQEREALESIAKSEIRDLREQARYLIRLELERRCLLLVQEDNKTIPKPSVEMGLDLVYTTLNAGSDVVIGSLDQYHEIQGQTEIEPYVDRGLDLENAGKSDGRNIKSLQP